MSASTLIPVSFWNAASWFATRLSAWSESAVPGDVHLDARGVDRIMPQLVVHEPARRSSSSRRRTGCPQAGRRSVRIADGELVIIAASAGASPSGNFV